MQKEITGMSELLLVKPKSHVMLFSVPISWGSAFEVWKDRNGVDLFWKGRQVEEVYSMSESGNCWWSVPIPSAASSLLKRGNAKRVKSRPAPEGELPR